MTNRHVTQVANRLHTIARHQNIDPYNALDAWLDYLIGTFDVTNLLKFHLDYEQVFTDARDRNPEMFSLMVEWFQAVTDAMLNGKGWIDFFGTVYEQWFKGRSKASALGQFYTPESLCDLMSQMVQIQDHERTTFNDCACGSGRTMLAAWARCNKCRPNWFEAGDIDFISCKMCALNFMVHGMLGIVKRQDALRLDTPAIIYHVNEVRYPIPVPYYSLRIEHPKQ